MVLNGLPNPLVFTGPRWPVSTLFWLQYHVPPCTYSYIHFVPYMYSAKKLGHDFDISNNPFITTENNPFLLDYMLI